MEKSGGQATIYQYVNHVVSGCAVADTRSRIAETLPDEVLAKMYAPPKPPYPILEPKDLPQFDAFLLGIPTRFGNFPEQWKVCPLTTEAEKARTHPVRSPRHSGTPPASCGPRVRWQANTPRYLCQAREWVADRRLRSPMRCLPWFTTASSSYLSGIPGYSRNWLTWRRCTAVSRLKSLALL